MKSPKDAKAAAFVAGVLFSYASVRSVSFSERVRRARLRREVQREIETILYSTEVVLERIRRGQYKYSGLEGALTDLDFEIITNSMY